MFNNALFSLLVLCLSWSIISSANATPTNPVNGTTSTKLVQMRPAVASIDDGTWNDISGAVHDISGFTSFVNHNTANAHFPLDIFSATYDSSGSTDQFEMPVTDVVNTGAEAEAYNGIDKSGENIGDMKSLDFSEPPVAVLLGVGVLLLKLVRRRKLLKAMEK